jgi:hypothetical protein
MEPESRVKSFLMVLGLAAFAGAGIACFGLFRSSAPEPAPTACEGLEGQARTDCESRQAD